MANRKTEPRTEIGRLLEKERENRNLERDEWYEVIGIRKPAYLSWLTNPFVDIQRPNVERIAEVLGITTTEVYGVLAEQRKGVYLAWPDAFPNNWYEPVAA